MNQLTQEEHDYLFFRLANDIARSQKTYSRRRLASEAANQLMSMTIKDARELAAETKKDMELLYRVYQATATHE